MPNFSKDKSGFQMKNPMSNVTGVTGATNTPPGLVGSYGESPSGESPVKFWGAVKKFAGKALDPLGLFKKNKGGGGGKGGDGAHTHGAGGTGPAVAGGAPAGDPAAAPAEGAEGAPAAPAEGAAPEEEVAPQ